MSRVLALLALIYWKWPTKWYGKFCAVLLVLFALSGAYVAVIEQRWGSLFLMIGVYASAMSIGPAVHWYAGVREDAELLELIEDLRRTRSMRHAS